jgi:hypothetical protein
VWIILRHREVEELRIAVHESEVHKNENAELQRQVGDHKNASRENEALQTESAEMRRDVEEPQIAVSESETHKNENAGFPRQVGDHKNASRESETLQTQNRQMRRAVEELRTAVREGEAQKASPASEELRTAVQNTDRPSSSRVKSKRFGLRFSPCNSRMRCLKSGCAKQRTAKNCSRERRVPRRDRRPAG